jgi:hypothetical protein
VLPDKSPLYIEGVSHVGSASATSTPTTDSSATTTIDGETTTASKDSEDKLQWWHSVHGLDFSALQVCCTSIRLHYL